MDKQKSSILSRRDFLRMTAVVGAGVVVARCGGGQTTAVGEIAPVVDLKDMTINYLGWEGYDSADALIPLTEPNNITVNSTYGGNNEEIFSKLKAGSQGQYDVISIYYGNIPDLIDNDLVQPLDLSRLEYYDNMYVHFKDANFNKRDGNLYSFPFTFGESVCIYNPEFVPDGIQSWGDLAKPEYTGKVVQLDNWADLWIGLLMTGGDISEYMTQAQLEEAKNWLLGIKPQVRAISPSYGEQTDMLARKEVWLTTFGWDAQVEWAAEKGVTLKTVIPKEGVNAWVDNYLIPKGANLDAAYAFINQMTSPDGAAVLAQSLNQKSTNSKVVSLLPEEFQAKYENIEENLERSPFPPQPPANPTDPNIASFADVTAAWEEYKAA